jgi:DNA processing protein
MALIGDGHDAEHRWQLVSRRRGATIAEVAQVLGDEAPAVASRWAEAAAQLDPDAVWRRHRDAGIGIATPISPSYPAVLRADRAAPSVVFHQGNLDSLAGHRVAVVGTRDCTHYGRDVAYGLGRDLAAAGVSVVSGLALGIDGAAHRGALDAPGGAPPVAVVGCGLDVVYPKRHRDLRDALGQRGVVLSEHPLGRPPTALHFPWRNRIIAALSDVVVVVESHHKGGALHTAREADDRGIGVLAVPGPVTSKASEGTNAWLSDHPSSVLARDVGDVLVALGLSGPRRTATERRRAPLPAHQQVLDAMGWQPASLEQLALRVPTDLASLAGALDQLEVDGWVTARGGWFERVARDRC